MKIFYIRLINMKIKNIFFYLITKKNNKFKLKNKKLIFKKKYLKSKRKKNDRK